MLNKQVEAATSANGVADPAKLIDSNSETYAQDACQRDMADRDVADMADRNRALTKVLEAQVVALRLSNERFAGAIESLSHGLCIYDPQHCLVVANRRYGELYDLPAEKLAAGTHLLDVVADAASRGLYRDAQTVENATEALAEIAEHGFCERTRHLSNGTIIHITFNRLVDGGWIALHKDITHQRYAEHRLIESEQRFRDFVATASDWCWETDRNHCFCFLTPTFQAMTGFAPESMYGKTRHAFAVEPDDQDALDNMQALIDARMPFEDLVYRILRADGSRCWIKSSGAPLLDADGGFVGYRGTGSDITADQERKLALAQSEARLRDFLDTASDWTWETDVEGRVVDLSHSY
ncbi:MAG: PAS domain-containing protein, partial [Bosea sp. (in: a-proteobacteria)]